MKKLIGMLSIMLGLSGGLWAARFEGNPDKVPSFKQDLKVNNGRLVLDFRAPVSNSVTLNAAIGLTGSSSEAKETALLLGQKADTNGVSFNVGIRVYLQ